MKVVRIHEYGSPDVLKYETVEHLSPAAGEILIKVESASVNYSDVARRSKATYPFPTPLPFIPGSEVAGVVEALGEGVETPPVGTPVFALVGSGSNGYAQYALTPADQVIPIPPSVSADQAAALPVAGTTALMILRETAQLKVGETVLIQGAAGGVGSYAVQLAKLLGAGKIIGAVSSEEKKQKVLELGADATVDYTQPDWPEQVRQLTGGKGVDVILEMSGNQVFAQGLTCLAPFGRCVVYGMASKQPLTFDEQAIIRFFYDPSLNQSIHVYNFGLWFGMRTKAAAKAMEDLIAYVASGQVKVQIDQVMPLSKAAEAHKMLEQRQTKGKIILKPWLDI
jgi:NADPH:quinone reductase